MFAFGGDGDVDDKEEDGKAGGGVKVNNEQKSVFIEKIQ